MTHDPWSAEFPHTSTGCRLRSSAAHTKSERVLCTCRCLREKACLLFHDFALKGTLSFRSNTRDIDVFDSSAGPDPCQYPPMVGRRDEPQRSAQHTRVHVAPSVKVMPLWDSTVEHGSSSCNWTNCTLATVVTSVSLCKASSPPTALSDSVSWWHVSIALLKIALDVSCLLDFFQVSFMDFEVLLLEA